jgi:hypothetical protein
MKSFKTLCAVALSVLSLSVTAQEWLTNGLVAYFPFNGTAADVSGNGNNGTVSDAVLAVDRFGTPNSAYAFDGVSSFIRVPDSSSLRIANDITVTCWVNFAEPNMAVRLLGKGGYCGKNYGLWYDQGLSWMFQEFPPEGGCIGGQENTASATPNAVPGQWYQVVGLRSGNVARLYVNGVHVATSPVCSSSTYVGNESLLIGTPDPADPPSNPPATRMHGSLDDIRIYNRALTSDEVSELYRIEAGPQIHFVKAFTVDGSNLAIGSNYQVQASADLNAWTNFGPSFTATSRTYTNSNYQRVENWDRLFFRLQLVP